MSCARPIENPKTKMLFTVCIFFQGQPVAEEIIQHFMNGGNAAELKKDFIRGNRPDYVSPLDDLAFDIYQVSSFPVAFLFISKLVIFHIVNYFRN